MVVFYVLVLSYHMYVRKVAYPRWYVLALRPILVQLDLQSVEKVPFSIVRSHEFLPRKCWKLVFLAS